MIHTTFKAKEYKVTGNAREAFEKTRVPEEGKKIIEAYHNPKVSIDDLDRELGLLFDDRFVFGYDYIFDNKKLFLPEIDPVSVFFSNSLMFAGMIEEYKLELLNTSIEVSKVSKRLDLSTSGMFMQYAINITINLQASLECFSNRLIPANHQFETKKGRNIDASKVSFETRLFSVIPQILKPLNHLEYHKDIEQIKKLIELRNNIIHLKPKQQTNTPYKSIFKDMLDFDFLKTLEAVRNFINFYQENLIEVCTCGNEHIFEIIIRKDGTKHNIKLD